MILVEQVLHIHDLLIQKYGGVAGIRDMSLLESAINRPYATYASQSLYPNPISQASVLLESLIGNHPFVDGNKRTGYLVFRSFLQEHGYDINLSMDQKYEFVINIASGELKGPALIRFVELHVIKK